MLIRSPKRRLRAWLPAAALAVVMASLTGCSLGFLGSISAFDLVATSPPAAISDYTFAGVLTDSLGTSPAVTLQPGAVSASPSATYVTDRHGTPGSALGVPLRSTTSFTVTIDVNNQAFTLGAWVKALNDPASTSFELSAEWGVSAQTGLALGTHIGLSPSGSSGSSSTLLLAVDYEGASGTSLAGPGISTGAGTWHHITLTVDDLGRERLYLDGTEQEALTTQEAVTKGKVTIGFDSFLPYSSQSSSGPAGAVYGISDLQVFAGALDSSQVGQLYKGTLKL